MPVVGHSCYPRQWMSYRFKEEGDGKWKNFLCILLQLTQSEFFPHEILPKPYSCEA